jgi:hypothetical protein
MIKMLMIEIREFVTRGAMSLIHDLAAKLKVLWNHKVVLKPQNSIGILSEALCFSQL